MHLKCHVWEHGATNRHWQGCSKGHQQSPLTLEDGNSRLTAIEFKQIEQS